MGRNRGLTVLLLVIAAVGLVVQFTDWPPWAVIVGGVSLAVGALVLVPSRTGRPARVVVGRVPPLAPAFQPRTGIQAQLTEERENDNDVVLHGTGGTGTTQLAAAAAHEAIRSGADLVVWVDAASPASVVTAFALAAYQVAAPGVTGADASVDAHALVRWLEETDSRWLVVFDDVTDLASLDEWWPVGRSQTGWVVATTTRPVSDGRWTTVEVGPFTAAEAHEYLADCKLVDDDAADLAAELGHLPLALHRAVRYLRAERLTCGGYLQRWIDRRKIVADPAEAAVLLAVDAAQRHLPPGRALSTLRMAAVLDPAGQPAAVWKHPAVAAFVKGVETGASDAGLRSVFGLRPYGLVDLDRRLGPWAVRMHPDTAHTVRRNMPATLRATAARAAADAVLDTWPDDDAYPQQAVHVQVLRANADVLARLDGDPLWDPKPHELLWRAGISLERAGLYAAAIRYWQHLVDTGERLHGPQHEATLTAVGRLAASQREAGRATEAVATYGRVVEGLAKLHGPADPRTLDATESLAIAYLADGRHDDAVDTATRLVTDRVKQHGQRAEETVKARFVLATCLRHAGRPAAAATQFELVREGYSELRGPQHPDTEDIRRILADVRREEKSSTDSRTLLARRDAALAKHDAGNTDEAIRAMTTVVDDLSEALGPRHPDTIEARTGLATLYLEAGRTDEAKATGRQVVTDIEAVHGELHPLTLTARTNLAHVCRRAGDTDEAIALTKEVLAAQTATLGPDHADTTSTAERLAEWTRDS